MPHCPLANSSLPCPTHGIHAANNVRCPPCSISSPSLCSPACVPSKPSPRQEADAARLLELVRGHWAIDNNLHGERDGALGEDGWRVRSGDGPQVLAATRNALRMLLEERQTPNKAAAMRRFVIRPLEAFDLIASKPKH